MKENSPSNFSLPWQWFCSVWRSFWSHLSSLLPAKSIRLSSPPTAKPSRLLAQFLVSIITIAIVLLLLLLLTSCAPVRYIPLPERHSCDSLHVTSDRRYDSIYIDRTHIELLHRGIPEIPKTTDWGQSLISSFRVDTMVVKDSIYVEKVHDVEVHDTVTVVRRDSVPYPVEVIREVPSPIPRFYKNCTLAFWLIIIGFILYIAARLYLRR